MSDFTLKQLAQIIERESKDSTYKFALLRGTIDVIQNYHHYRITDGERMAYPLGLLIIKWIDYYYPLLANDIYVPQRNGDQKDKKSIAFRKEFNAVIELYPGSNSSEPLLHDLKNGISDSKRMNIILTLIKELKRVIVNNPMKYIGSAVQLGGQIYKYQKDATISRGQNSLRLEWIIQSMGTFSVPIAFYDVLQVVGTFISGTNSIIFKWAEFTSNLTNDVKITTSDMISLLSQDVSERDVLQAKNFYNDILSKDELFCVWSGKKLKNDLNVDHVFPFVALRNNDLWNLLPTNDKINNKKRDNIPNPELLSNAKVKERIIFAWEQLASSFEEQFFSEIRISLLGREKIIPNNWKNQSYKGLTDMSRYLIEDRGLNSWQFKHS